MDNSMDPATEMTSIVQKPLLPPQVNKLYRLYKCNLCEGLLPIWVAEDQNLLTSSTERHQQKPTARNPTNGIAKQMQRAQNELCEINAH